MKINEAIEDIETILKSMELNHMFNVTLYEDDKEAFKTIVKYVKRDKKAIKELLLKVADKNRKEIKGIEFNWKYRNKSTELLILDKEDLKELIKLLGGSNGKE